MHKTSGQQQLYWRRLRRSVPQLLAGFGMLFVAVGVIISLLLSMVVENESQDVRRGASGVSTYQLATSESEIALAKRNADGIGVHAVLLKDGFLLQDQADITYTWSVANQTIVTLAPKSFTAAEGCPYKITAPCPALHAVIKPLALGSTTVTVVAKRGSTELAQTSFSVAVQDSLADNALVTSKPYEDFYYPSEKIVELSFWTANGSESVSADSLKVDQEYRAKYKTTIQNKLKSTFAEDTKLSVQFTTNLNSADTTVSIPALSSSAIGTTVEFEQNFRAVARNMFQVLLDHKAQFREADENNNVYNQEVSATQQNRTFISCNQRCSSNSECEAGLTCYDSNGEKRCRYASNVGSTSCNTSSTTTTTSGSKSCDQGCANSSECSSGLTCWYNRCRSPEFLESTVCSSTGSTTTRTTTVAGCNAACTSNRDCGSGLRCYQNSCRYPLNPVSTTCSPQSNTTAGGGVTTIPAATPRTTPKATATPSPVVAKPATQAATPATPLPTAVPVEPTPAPNESALDAIMATITGYFSGLSISGAAFGVPLPLLVIGIGILLLVIAGIALVLSNLRSRPKVAQLPQLNTAPPARPLVAADQPRPPAPVGVLPSQPLPPAPSIPVAPPRPVTAPAPQPVAMPAPTPQPVTPQQITRPPSEPVVSTAVVPVSSAPVRPTPAPVITPPVSTAAPHGTPQPSLVERLKQKGIELPHQPPKPTPRE